MRRRTLGAMVLGVAVAAGLLAAAPRAEGAGARYRDPVFASWTRTADIPYGAAVNSRGELQSLELDLYEPTDDTETARPVYIWVHGGFFIRGSKLDVPRAVRDYALAGWVVASIEYRLRPELPEGAVGIVTEGKLLDGIAALVDGQHDAQAAVRWVRENAGARRLDPNRIAIGGHSAGGIIANSVNFNETDPGTSGNPGHSSRVRAAVVHAGGGLPFIQATPGPGDGPVLYLHGVLDDIVPIPVSPPFCVLTVLMLNPCEYIVRVNQGHGVFGTERSLDFLYRRVILGHHLPLIDLDVYPD